MNIRKQIEKHILEQAKQQQYPYSKGIFPSHLANEIKGAKPEMIIEIFLNLLHSGAIEGKIEPIDKIILHATEITDSGIRRLNPSANLPHTP